MIVPVSLTVEEDGPPALLITGFFLIDADDDTIIREINDGEVIDLSTLPSKRLNIMVTTEPEEVSKVIFAFNSGRIEASLRDYFAPYSLFGDWWGNYFGIIPVVRDYTLSAVPYLDRREGESKSINFKVIRSNDEKSKPIAYPNPFTDRINIKFPDQYTGFVSVTLFDRYHYRRFLGIRILGYGDNVLT